MRIQKRMHKENQNNKVREDNVNKQNNSQSDNKNEVEEKENKKNTELSKSLDENIETLKQIITDSSDVIIRGFTFGRQNRAAIIHIDGLVDKALVNENVLKPLMYMNYPARRELPEKIDLEYLKSELIFVNSIDTKKSVGDIVSKMLSGDTILLLDGESEALIMSLRGWQMRGIEEPQTESTVRGSREGFTETLRINTSMIRRKIKNPNLKFETITIGDRTETDVCIVYIEGLAKNELIEEIKQRFKKIKTDAILESGYIEQYIEDAPYSIFSTIANSEKPDKVAAKLLEGRAAILVDGSPFVLTVPMLFVESFQAAEDYYSRPFFASAIKLLRYIAFFISILAPALYVAMSTFHQELIPTQLLLSMAAAHEGIPFPSVVEAALMLVVFEILREAGVRLPRPIGQAVSIVGALVIGESAVSAGLIGAPMVIVIAITAVATFAVSAQTDSCAIIRFFLLILAGIMGGYGIAIGLLVTLIHLSSLRSFGTPYLMPIAPFNRSGMKDTFIRAPLWTMKKRPLGISMDEIRQSGDINKTKEENQPADFGEG